MTMTGRTRYIAPLLVKCALGKGVLLCFNREGVAEYLAIFYLLDYCCHLNVASLKAFSKDYFLPASSWDFFYVQGRTQSPHTALNPPRPTCTLIWNHQKVFNYSGSLDHTILDCTEFQIISCIFTIELQTVDFCTIWSWFINSKSLHL